MNGGTIKCGGEEQVFKVGRIKNLILDGKRFGLVRETRNLS